MEKELVERLVNDGKKWHLIYVRPKPTSCSQCGASLTNPWFFSCDGEILECGELSTVVQSLGGDMVIIPTDSIHEIQEYDPSKRR